MMPPAIPVAPMTGCGWGGRARVLPRRSFVDRWHRGWYWSLRRQHRRPIGWTGRGCVRDPVGVQANALYRCACWEELARFVHDTQHTRTAVAPKVAGRRSARRPSDPASSRHRGGFLQDAVVESEHPVRPPGESRVVRDQDRSGTGVDAVTEHPDHGATCDGVECAGGFIGEDQPRRACDGAGDGDTFSRAVSSGMRL
jgi:hypothetical protein